MLAYFGEIHPGVLWGLDVRGRAVGFEVFLDNLPPRRDKGSTRPPLHLESLQPVRRDFAFLVDADVQSGDLLRAARSTDRDVITDVALFDVYEGKNVEEGKKSLAIQVTLQPTESTFTDAEIDEFSGQDRRGSGKGDRGTLRG